MSNFLRQIFIYIDSVIYSLIATAYDLIVEISKINIFENTVDAFADRVYVLLAVFMLFRLSFSVLTYIINPETASDKSAGVGKLISNVLITLVMLISVPWIFNQAWKIQETMINENIVGKIILGTHKTGDYVAQQIDPGDNMAWITFSAFFKKTDEVKLEDITVENNLNAQQAYQRAEKSKNIRFIDKIGLTNVLDPNTNDYAFDYLPGISSLAGIFIAYILFLFSIQIALRSVKLGFLELIAPVPIISYLDPKQGKDGMFKKWYKLCLKTYADLFIRMAAIYFAVFLISDIDNIVSSSGSGFVKVLIIIGVLMFAKELPKFIEELTGVKLSGGFSLNPFKNNAALSALAGGAIGAGMGVTGAMSGAGVGGIFTGAARGMKSGFGGKKIGEITSAQSAKNAQMRQARLNGSSLGGRMGARLGNAFGLPTESQSIDAQINGIDEQIKDIENELKPTRDSIADRKAYTDKVKAMEDRAESKIKNGEAGDISLRYKELENRASELRDRLGRGEAGVSALDVANAEMAALNYLNDEAKYQYIDDVIAGKRSDSAMVGMQDDLLSMAKTAQTYTAADGTTVTINTEAVNAGAASRHSHAGKVTGTVNDDTRNTINPAETRKQGLEQEKARLYEDQRRAKSNESVIKK